MRNVLVCTVGTSLLGKLSNQEDSRFAGVLEKRDLCTLTRILQEIAPDDFAAVAEINSIAGILHQGLLAERFYLYLLASDTPEGEFVGRALQAYFQESMGFMKFEQTEMRAIDGLSHESPDRFRSEGLRNLVREIAEIVRRHHESHVLINATGGYKAQISFAGLIGQALEIPVCYLFEKFSEVIVLPPQPVSLDMGFWMANAPIFFSLDTDGLDHDPTRHDPRFASQRKAVLPPDSGIDPDRKAVKFEDRNGGMHKGLEPYLRNICRRPYVVRVFTHYFNPRLPLKNGFRLSAKGEVSQIEGSYSDGKATTKFNVVTTAETEEQRRAAVVDLCSSI